MESARPAPSRSPRPVSTSPSLPRTVRRSDVAEDPAGVGAGPLPGSLEETAEAIRAAGGEAHLIPLDLGDRDRLMPAAREAIAALGRVDVLVNNAIYTGPGNYERFLDADLDAMADRIEGNVDRPDVLLAARSSPRWSPRARAR